MAFYSEWSEVTKRRVGALGVGGLFWLFVMIALMRAR